MEIEISKEKFQASVATNLARTKGEMREVVEELRSFNNERQKETLVKRDISPQLIEAFRGNVKS